MPTILTNPGMRCEYNGHKFDPEYTHTTGLDISPVYDKAGRTVAYNRYSIRLKTWVRTAAGGGSGANTDVQVKAIRNKLTKAGGVLIFNDRGMGDVNINTSKVKDVLFGPKPAVLSLRFHGKKRTVEIDWSVEVHIPDCDDARYQFAIMELTYTVSHRPRRNGRVDRVVSGELRIPNNRAAPGGAAVLDSADRYREAVAAPVPRNFHREYGEWALDESRSRLRFGWVDSEFGSNVYPEGIVKASASHTTRSTNAGLLQWVSTIQAEYELAAGYDYKWGEKAFFRLVKDRVDHLIKQFGSKVGLLAVSYETAEPEIYGDPRVTFSASFKITDLALKDLIEGQGMWRADPGSNWTKWHTSVKLSSEHPYGYSRLTYQQDEDGILDLCGDPKTPYPAGTSLSAELKSIVSDFPKAANSWIEYENAVRVEADTGTVELRSVGVGAPQNPVPPAPPPVSPFQIKVDSSKAGVPAGSLEWFDKSPGTKSGSPLAQLVKSVDDYQPVAGLTAPPGALVSNVGAIHDNYQQRRSSPACYLYMTGYAIRAGFQIPCPQLVDVDGMKPMLSNRLDMGEGFVHGVIGNAGVPLYGARWNLRYFLPHAPDKPVTPPPNPIYGDERQ